MNYQFDLLSGGILGGVAKNSDKMNDRNRKSSKENRLGEGQKPKVVSNYAP